MDRLPFLRWFQPLQPDPEPTASEQPSEDQEQQPFYPTLFDVLKVRHLLRWTTIPEGGLPIEIVDIIIDEAEYWPSVETTTTSTGTIPRGKKIVVRQDEDRIVLRSEPLCLFFDTGTGTKPKILPHRTIHPCRKIIFRISSHDQGFGGGVSADGRQFRGGFEGSYSWFDTEVVHHQEQQERPSSEQQQQEQQPSPSQDTDVPTAESISVSSPSHPHFLPTSQKLQSNRVAVRETQHFTVTWHYRDPHSPQPEVQDDKEGEDVEKSTGRGRATFTGHIVRDLGIGDSIAIWARARFGAWQNHVHFVGVRVFWAV